MMTIEHAENSPLISVVIPCYNQAQYLHESVKSALASFSGAIEVIVVDDGSTDSKTAGLLEAAEGLSPQVKIIRQANQGLSAARNRGIAEARGTFLQLLDADDLIIPPKLDLQFAHFSVSPDLDVSVGNFLLCDASGTIFSKPDEAISHADFTLDDFLFKWERGFSIPIHCALFRRAALGLAPFDTEAKAKEDWLFWCALATRGARMAYLRTHSAIYRQHAQSMRRSVVNMSKSWMHAALKIDKMVAQSHPVFFDAAVHWLENYYRRHPNYQEEVVESRKEKVKASLRPSESKNELDVAVDAQRLLERLRVLDRNLDVKPAITIIVPIYNHYRYLDECLSSLACQGDVSLEVVCVEDASPDIRVRELLRSLAGKIERFRVIQHEKNCGITRSQDEAVAIARGEYLAFLDCDDALQEGALAKVVSYLTTHSEIDYLFSDRLDIDETGRVVRKAIYGGYSHLVPSSAENIKYDLLDGMIASHLKVVRRASYIGVGSADPSLSGVQDWELALKIAEGGVMAYLPEPLYKHRVHAESVTRSDSTSQFRKTNILRRRYIERWLVASERPVGGGCILRSDAGSLPALPELKRIRVRGGQCEFFALGVLPVPVLNFLREFNSYFDRIVWDDPTTYAGLVGFVWGDILSRLPDDRSLDPTL